MKQLVAVSWEMPPMYGPRGTQVARTLEHLGTLGWQSSVVCLAPRRGGPNWRDGLDAVSMGHVARVGVASPEESLVARAAFRFLPGLRNWPDQKRLWVAAAARAATAAARRVSAAGLITFAQPWSDHLVGLRVAAETNLPWVAHFSDPFVDSPYAKPRSTRQRDWWRSLERRIIERADAVIFVTSQTADLVMSKYPVEWRRKVHVVPHGFDRRFQPIRATRIPTEPLTLTYTGRFYRGIRTPSSLFRAMARLAAGESLAGRLRLRIIGPHTEEFASETKQLGLDSIVAFERATTPETALTEAARADALVLIDAPAAVSVFLPSKLVDYLMLRKPILGITPLRGASADVLRRAGCPVVAPDDVDGIASAIGAMLAASAAGSLTVGPDFDRVAAEFDIVRTTGLLHDVLTRTFERRAA